MTEGSAEALQRELAALRAERDGAQAREEALAEVLQAINATPGNPAPVFDLIVGKAMALCDAAFGALFALQDDHLCIAAYRDAPPAMLRFLDAPQPLSATNPDTVRLLREGKAGQIVDLRESNAYRNRVPMTVASVELAHIRTILRVPLVSGRGTIGLFVLYRQEVRPFTDRQVALVEAFAGQAALAMENARLLAEQREALEQQVASAEILRVISQSPTDVQPVFDAIARSAVRLCEGLHCALYSYDGTLQHLVAEHGVEPETLAALRAAYPRAPAASTVTGATLLDGSAIHLADLQADPRFADPASAPVRAGYRAVLGMPMLKDGRPIGVILVVRREARAFSDSQVELLQTFAAQAVIAIENVRLFTELRESLDQQTASAGVLRVISQSRTSVQPVFDAIAESALRLLNGWGVIVWRFESGRLQFAAARGGRPESVDALPGMLGNLSSDDIFVGNVLRHGAVQQIADVESEPVAPALRALARARGWRSNLVVPMMRESRLIGAITLARVEPGTFSEREIRLLQSFADQAVIAIENVRLFTELGERNAELSESLEQQTATADILRVISQSPTDVQPVLQAVSKAAVRFCGAEDVVIALRDGDNWVTAGHDGALTGQLGKSYPLTRETSPGRAILDGTTVHFPDIPSLDPVEFAAAHRISQEFGFKAALAAPMMREGVAIGSITLRKPKAGPFNPRQIALLESFAAQAVIALSNVRLFTELRQRTDDLQESLDYQTATSEVLEAIGRSTSDIQPVLDTMLKAALRLCRTRSGGIAIKQGEQFRYVATLGWDPKADAVFRNLRITPGRGTVAARVVDECRIVHIADVASDPEFEWPDMAELAQWHTALGVPLIREGSAIGAIAITRDRVEPFTDRQIALVKTFAEQAVIGMENARLLRELHQRTDDLTESLEYQTATSELLAVISRSTSDVQPVLDTMLAAAARLCDTTSGTVAIRHDEVFRHVATMGVNAQYGELIRRQLHRIDRSTTIGRVALSRSVVQIEDARADPDYHSVTTDAGNIRTLLGVPLLRDDEVIGVIMLVRDRVEPFNERQVSLVKTFADQAVIAMENARLLAELRESLDQQTATSDVLKTISRSSVNLETVLETLVETVARLCRADQAYMFRRREELHHLVASHGLSPAALDFIRSHPFAPDEGTTSGRVVLRRQTVHIDDVLADPAYGYSEGQRVAGFRTMLGIPLMAQNEIIGVFVISRTVVAPFSNKEIALATGFADQAVIAIENARLLGELTRREQELRVTFDHMGDGVVMFDGNQRLAAWNRNFQELLDVPDSFLATRPTLEDYVRLLVKRGEFGRADLEAELTRLRAQFSTTWSTERTRPDGRIVEVRNNPVPGGGAVLIYSDVTERKQAEAEIRAARDAAEAALDKLQAAQANLIQAEKMASLGQLTAGIAHEIKNPLNFVNNFAALSVELIDELKEAAEPALAALDGERRAELDETMSLLVGNLGKIAEHGRRADGIVRSMLSHSRGGSGDWQACDINALVEETLNLAYHGARAQDNEFNVTLERDYDKPGQPIEVVPQDVTRVFLNLFGNGFYATGKRRLASREARFRPVLRVSTRDLGDAVEIRVRDNGIGIPTEIRDKLFQPFFTTKPTGEGTGLGLSISYDIVTQQHGGTIAVDSEPGVFTEFTVRLPRRRRTAPAERSR